LARRDNVFRTRGHRKTTINRPPDLPPSSSCAESRTRFARFIWGGGRFETPGVTVFGASLAFSSVSRKRRTRRARFAYVPDTFFVGSKTVSPRAITSNEPWYPDLNEGKRTIRTRHNRNRHVSTTRLAKYQFNGGTNSGHRDRFVRE